MKSLRVWQGGARDARIQCRLMPSGSTPAVFNSSDVLTAAVYQSGVVTAIFAPTVGWNTKDASGVTQTGYDQGQVLVSITAAQSLLLQPTVSYTLVVSRALAADSSDPEPIASVPLLIRSMNGS